MTNISKHTEK